MLFPFITMEIKIKLQLVTFLLCTPTHAYTVLTSKEEMFPLLNRA